MTPPVVLHWNDTPRVHVWHPVDPGSRPGGVTTLSLRYTNTHTHTHTHTHRERLSYQTPSLGSMLLIRPFFQCGLLFSQQVLLDDAGKWLFLLSTAVCQALSLSLPCSFCRQMETRVRDHIEPARHSSLPDLQWASHGSHM